MLKEFGIDVQKLFLDFMLTDAENFVRVRNIFNVSNFDKALKPVADFIKRHSDEYNTLPEINQLKAATGFNHTPINDMDIGHQDWFLDEFESFTKRKELERAILKSADLLEKGNYDPVEGLIKDAVQISLTRDLGTDYFGDPKERLNKLKDRTNRITTGYGALDRILYGGFDRGTLNIFAGGSGSGKSLVKLNLALNWLEMGLNGVFITLELSEGLCAQRVDSMMTGIESKNILRDIDNVELRVKAMSKKMGKFRIKYLPAQSTVNQIRAYLKELKIKENFKLDFLCVDYLDLLMPASTKISMSDFFTRDKLVSEELRNLAHELNVIFVTSSQLNRSSVEEIEFDHSHIAGGISKINTADNVFGIFTNRGMREKGRYQLQAMKTRSSSGVGQKIELSYNMETLRIGNLSDDDEPIQSQGTSIMNAIKNSQRSSETIDQETGEIKTVKAEVQSAKLKDLLQTIRRV